MSKKSTRAMVLASSIAGVLGITALTGNFINLGKNDYNQTELKFERRDILNTVENSNQYIAYKRALENTNVNAEDFLNQTDDKEFDDEKQRLSEIEKEISSKKKDFALGVLNVYASCTVGGLGLSTLSDTIKHKREDDLEMSR